MKTVVISVVSISSMLFVIMIQSSVNAQTRMSETLANALEAAMYQTMSEVMEQGSYGIRDRNEMTAAFLQALIQRTGADMDLTVRIFEMDYERGIMEVEAAGTIVRPGTDGNYPGGSGRISCGDALPENTGRTVAVKRRIVFGKGGQ